MDWKAKLKSSNLVGTVCTPSRKHIVPLRQVTYGKIVGIELKESLSPVIETAKLNITIMIKNDRERDQVYGSFTPLVLSIYYRINKLGNWICHLNLSCSMSGILDTGSEGIIRNMSNQDQNLFAQLLEKQISEFWIDEDHQACILRFRNISNFVTMSLVFDCQQRDCEKPKLNWSFTS